MSKVMGKQAARKVLKSAEAGIASVLAYVEAERATFESRIGRFEVRIAMMLDEGAEACAILSEDWRVWARGVLPGKSAPTVYRWRNAGKVARILRGSFDEETGTYPANILGEVPAALIGSLVPLYRILQDAKTEEDRTDAAALIRETYADVLKSCETFTETVEDGETIVSPIPPTMETVLAAAEAASPSKRSGGKSTGSATTGGEKDGQTDTAEEGENEDEGEARRETAASLLVIDPAAVEAAAGPTDAIVRGLCRDLKVSRETVLSIGLAFLRLGAEHGVSNVQAVLAKATPVADAAKTAA